MTEQALSDRRQTPWVVTWLTWPTMFVFKLIIIWLAITRDWSFSMALGVTTGLFIVLLVTLEFRCPLADRWRMTVRSFFNRDLKYFLVALQRRPASRLVQLSVHRYRTASLPPQRQSRLGVAHPERYKGGLRSSQGTPRLIVRQLSRFARYWRKT